jgi:hypothetical protein
MSLVDLEDEVSPIPSNPRSVDAFGIMMAPQTAGNPAILRDRCFRPTPTYNENYDPTKPPNPLNKAEYSPYAFGEPLFNDRPIRLDRLRVGHVIAGATKRKRVQWTWKLGYALINNTKASKPIIWCCKLCTYLHLNLQIILLTFN